MAAAPAPEPAAAPGTISQTLNLTCPTGGANKSVRTSSGLRIPLRCEADQVGSKSYLARVDGKLIRLVVAAPAAPAPAPAPAPVISPVAAPVAAATAPAPVRSVRITCPSQAGVSHVYANDGTRVPAGCGPQTKEAVTYYVRGADGSLTRVEGIPAGLAVSTAAPVLAVPAAPAPKAFGSAFSPTPAVSTPVAVPAGYREVWDDDRLNPNRGPQGGGMQLVWTNTSPRKLIDPTTGKNYLSRFRNLVYPCTPSAREIALIEAGKIVTYTRACAAASAPASPSGAQVVVSTSSAGASSAQAVASAFKWVQVGTYGVQSNATASARRMKALGLPVRFAKTTSGGKALKIVLVGPFSDAGALNAALAKVRGAGYSDAYLRR